MTDHYIQRRPARDLLADIAERTETYKGNVVLYYPPSLPKPEDELYLAIAQVSQNSNLTEGITRLSAAIEKYRPERPEYYVQLGDALRKDGKFEQSIPLYEEALRRRPQSISTLRKLALSLTTMKQPARAVEILKRALEASPDDATAWQQLGLLYIEQSKTLDAIAALQKAIALDSDSPKRTTVSVGFGSRLEMPRVPNQRCEMQFEFSPIMRKLIIIWAVCFRPRGILTRRSITSKRRFDTNPITTLRDSTMRLRWAARAVWMRRNGRSKRFCEPIRMPRKPMSSWAPC